jgi:hypothetical protein
MTILNRPLIKNLTLLFVSLLVSVLLAELVVRKAGWKPMFTSQSFRFFEYHPVLGWAHKPGQESEFSDKHFRTSVRINQKGLRGLERGYERTNEKKRILVLGDSLAWGHGVEEANRFSEVLETLLPVEVINAGVAGYSTDQELLWLKDEGINYDIDLVIVVFCGNDERANHRQLVYESYYKPYFTLNGDAITLNNVPVPKHIAHKEPNLGRSLVMSARVHSSLVNLVWRHLFENAHVSVSSGNSQDAMSPTSTSQRPFELTIRLLREMRTVAQSRGAKFMIVSSSAWWDNRPEKPYPRFIDTLRQGGFLVLDLESIDGYDDTTMQIPNDRHWNAEGHGFVARETKTFIEMQQLIRAQVNSVPR